MVKINQNYGFKDGAYFLSLVTELPFSPPSTSDEAPNAIPILLEHSILRSRAQNLAY